MKKNRNILFSFPRLMILCDKVCQWLVTGRWFSPGTPVSPTNKTDSDYITEILLKVGLNTINIHRWTKMENFKIHKKSTIRLNQSPDLRMQTCCYMYFLVIQCKRQNIPDHAFCSYSVLNRRLSYICNISFLEVHLERVANSIWLARICCFQ